MLAEALLYGKRVLFRLDVSFSVIACDKREAFAQGSEATTQYIYPLATAWIASPRSQ
jgi:hypothetical protein